VTPGYVANNRDVSLSGVRVTGVLRNADAFRQAEVRRTAADTARADTEVTGLEMFRPRLKIPASMRRSPASRLAPAACPSPTDTPCARRSSPRRRP
jgi:flagellar hook-associated protein 1 FlgK